MGGGIFAAMKGLRICRLQVTGARRLHVDELVVCGAIWACWAFAIGCGSHCRWNMYVEEGVARLFDGAGMKVKVLIY